MDESAEVTTCPMCGGPARLVYATDEFNCYLTVQPDAAERIAALEAVLRRLVEGDDRMKGLGVRPCDTGHILCLVHGYLLPCPVGEARRLLGMEGS